MRGHRPRCTAIPLLALLLLFAVAACSNGRGSLSETPPASPGQLDPPAPGPSPTPAPNPTPAPSPAPPSPDPPSPDPPPPAPPPPSSGPVAALAGFWQGTISQKKSAWSARALVAASGAMHFVVTERGGLEGAPQFIVYGNVCCASKVDVDLSSMRYGDGRKSDVRFRASLERGAFVGKFKVRGDDYEFSINRSSRYDEALTLADLAGTYTRTTSSLLGSGALALTLDTDGGLTGSQTNGCVYTGSASLPDAPRNLVHLDVELSNCGGLERSLNGRYSGLGVLLRDSASSDSPQTADVFFHSLVGPRWLGATPVER